MEDIETAGAPARRRGYVAADVFCGGGGLSLGLTWAGFRVSAAVDTDLDCLATHHANMRSVGVHRDVAGMSGLDLLRSAGTRPWTLDLLAGSPPCQGWSQARRNGHAHDDRNNLVFEFARLVREASPRTFVMENVAMLAARRGQAALDALRNIKGYSVCVGVYNCADYGVAQTRRRMVAVGTRHDIPAFVPPPPTASRWLTVGEALSGLPEPPADGSEHPDYPNHFASRMSPMNCRRFSTVPPGGGWRDIPEELRLACHRRIQCSSGRWPDVYGRLRADAQAPTITCGFGSVTKGRYGHPASNRAITAREAARLQGFPDRFAFRGDRDSVRRQVGNAVPPPLAEAIGLAIARLLIEADGDLADPIRD